MKTTNTGDLWRREGDHILLAGNTRPMWGDATLIAEDLIAMLGELGWNYAGPVDEEYKVARAAHIQRESRR